MQQIAQRSGKIIALYQMTTSEQRNAAFTDRNLLFNSSDKLSGTRGQHSLTMLQWDTICDAVLFSQRIKESLGTRGDPMIFYFRVAIALFRKGGPEAAFVFFQTDKKDLYDQVCKQATNAAKCISMLGGEKLHQEDRWERYKQHDAYGQYFLLVAVFSNHDAALSFATRWQGAKSYKIL